jgi:mannose-6-phosphate isomerase-like protein (cupin superfamily)
MFSSMQPLTAIDPDPDPAGAWFAEQVAATAAGGQVAMVERSAAAGSMPPLSRRAHAETYRVLEGEVLFFVGTDVVCASAGDVVVAPPGVARTFRVASEVARWLVLTQVRSLERFTDFGRAVTAAIPSPPDGWPSEDERATVAAIGAANGIELLGPPGALPGLTG